ncbi:MAG: hypothetical protein KH136_08730 [Oscillibacter sp.]|nr:hypothetical protein [Oscillibacter sp.]
MEEDLPAEVNRLRAENEYLKKLQALVPEGERCQRKEAGYYDLILKPVKKLEKLFNRFCMRRHSVFSHAVRAHSARDS